MTAAAAAAATRCHLLPPATHVIGPSLDLTHLTHLAHLKVASSPSHRLPSLIKPLKRRWDLQVCETVTTPAATASLARASMAAAVKLAWRPPLSLLTAITYVCMYVCKYVCKYVCVQVCMHVCMHVCIMLWLWLDALRE